MIADEIIKKLKTLQGYRIWPKKLKIICYVDDAMITTKNENDTSDCGTNFILVKFGTNHKKATIHVGGRSRNQFI